MSGDGKKSSLTVTGRIMAKGSRDNVLIGKTAWLGFFALLLAFITTALFLYSRPKTFQAGALGEFKGHGPASSPLEAVTSDQVLERVIRDLHLANKFGMAEGPALVSKVRRRIRAEPIIGTDLVHFIVLDVDEQRAVDIADGIVKTYNAAKKQETDQKNKRSLAELDDKTKAQESHLEQARLKMENVLDSFKDAAHQERIDLLVDDFKAADDETTCLIAYYARSVSGLAREINEYRSQIAGLGELKGEDLPGKAAVTVLHDSTINNVDPTFQELWDKARGTEESDDVRDGLSNRLRQADSRFENEMQILREKLDAEGTKNSKADEAHQACPLACAEYVQAFDAWKLSRVNELKERIGGGCYDLSPRIELWTPITHAAVSPMRILRPFLWVIVAVVAGYGVWCFWRLKAQRLCRRAWDKHRKKSPF